jgi:hypothetical protein
MKKKNNIQRQDGELLEAYTHILYEQPPVDPAMMGDPMAGGAPMPPEGGQNIPADAVEPEPEKEPLTPEGQVYLWEMIRKALAFNGQDSLTPEEKSLFETGVTQENFPEMRERIMAIFTRHISGPLGPTAHDSENDDELSGA